MQLLTTKELALLVGAQPGYRVVLTETEESGNRWWGMRIDLPQGKSYQIITTRLPKCLDSWDHVPMRSWPLFKARHVLRTLFQSDSSLATR